MSGKDPYETAPRTPTAPAGPSTPARPSIGTPTGRETGKEPYDTGPRTPTLADDYFAPDSAWDIRDSATAPGFQVSDGISIGAYNSWLTATRADPRWAPLISAYGNRFLEFLWYASRTQMDESRFANSMNVSFPGWQKVGGGGSPGPAGGGSGSSLAERYASAEAAVRNQAATLGLPMDDAAIKALARKVVTDNWSGDQLMDHLLNDPNKITQAGSFTAMTDQVKKMASSQLVRISEETAKDWSRRILSGELELQTVGSILQQQAATEFGWASESLKAGITMSDMLAPARDTVAAELEMSSAQIDLMDPQFRKLVQVDNSDGTRRAATLTEAQRNARADSRYANTAGSARLSAQTATILRRVFEGG